MARSQKSLDQRIHEFNFDFGEEFFHAVFRRIGWEKVARVPNHQTVDYIGDGYALELKNLRSDPLEADSRQKRLIEFQNREYLAGNIVVDWVNHCAAPIREKRREFSSEVWRLHLGNSLRNDMIKCCAQISSTRLLRPSVALRGAILIVNESVPAMDSRGLAQLMATYLAEPQLAAGDVAFGFCPKLESSQGIPAHLLSCAAKSDLSQADRDLQNKLSDAIAAEVSAKIGGKFKPAEGGSGLLRPRLSQKVKFAAGPFTLTFDESAPDLEPGFAGIVKRSWNTAKAHADQQKGNETHRCHYVPRFLLKRWADGNGKLNVWDVPGDRPSTKTDPADVAVREDIYTLLEPTGERERRFLEKFFQIVEDAAALTLAGPFLYPELENGNQTYHFVPFARQVLALFSAVQALRLPSVLDALALEWKKDWQENWGIAGDQLPHRGNLLFRLLGGHEPFAAHGGFLASVAESFHRKRWTFFCYPDGRRFQTGDIPLIIPVREGMLVSTNLADWTLQLPIGPNGMLALDERYPDGSLMPENLYQIDPTRVLPIWNPPGLRERVL